SAVVASTAVLSTVRRVSTASSISTSLQACQVASCLFGSSFGGLRSPVFGRAVEVAAVHFPTANIELLGHGLRSVTHSAFIPGMERIMSHHAAIAVMVYCSARRNTWNHV